jgi:hypothetical protein
VARIVVVVVADVGWMELEDLLATKMETCVLVCLGDVVAVAVAAEAEVGVGVVEADAVVLNVGLTTHSVPRTGMATEAAQTAMMCVLALVVGWVAASMVGEVVGEEVMRNETFFVLVCA